MTTPPLHPDFREFIGSLMRRQARFLVVGAHALAALGRARMTDDLDLLLEPSTENARRVAETLRDFGGFDALAEKAAEHLSEPDRLVSIGRAPVSIDLLTGLSGVTFAEAWAGRDQHLVDGMTISFLGLAEMVRTKRAAGRTKNLLDLELLAEAGLIEPR